MSILHMVGARPRGSAGPVLIFRGLKFNNNLDQDWNFTNCDIGTEPNTLIVISMATGGENQSNASNKMNVGAVALTRLSNNYRNPSNQQFGHGIVSPTGPVTISVGITGSFSGYGMAVGIWTITGYANAAPVQHLTTQGAEGTRTLTMAYPDAKAIGIFAAANGDTSAGAMSGTGVVQDGALTTGTSLHSHRVTVGHALPLAAGSIAAQITSSTVLNGLVIR